MYSEYITQEKDPESHRVSVVGAFKIDTTVRGVLATPAEYADAKCGSYSRQAYGAHGARDVRRGWRIRRGGGKVK